MDGAAGLAPSLARVVSSTTGAPRHAQRLLRTRCPGGRPRSRRRERHRTCNVASARRRDYHRVGRRALLLPCDGDSQRDETIGRRPPPPSQRKNTLIFTSMSGPASYHSFQRLDSGVTSLPPSEPRLRRSERRRRAGPACAASNHCHRLYQTSSVRGSSCSWESVMA